MEADRRTKETTSAAVIKISQTAENANQVPPIGLDLCSLGNSWMIAVATEVPIAVTVTGEIQNNI